MIPPLGTMPECHCKLCEHRKGVETPLHPRAYEWWAHKVNREGLWGQWSAIV